MMYSQLFVTCIKVNGRILKETKGEVRVPFGSEYSVLIKNLNSVRAIFKLSIDGKDTSDYSEGKIIIPANQSVEIERYIAGGNFHEGNKFKFIERTDAVEKHRGVGAEDGLVRVEFWKEVIRPYVPYIPSTPYVFERRNPCPDPWRNPWDRRDRRRSNPFGRNLYKNSGIMRGVSGNTTSTSGPTSWDSNSMLESSFSDSVQTSGRINANSVQFNTSYSTSDVGVTAPGGISSQQFTIGSYFETEPNSEVIVLHLKGDVGGKKVQVPEIARVKQPCVSCGKANKANAKFCSHCGTGLELVY